MMVLAHSVLLYRAKIWAGALRMKRCWRCHLSVQRQGALRIPLSCRTITKKAVLFVGPLIPIDLLANWVRREQQRWNESDVQVTQHSGRSTPNSWVPLKYSDVTFFRLLIDHNCFWSYLHVMEKAGMLTCWYCPEESDNVRHTFFSCN